MELRNSLSHLLRLPGPVLLAGLVLACAGVGTAGGGQTRGPTQPLFPFDTGAITVTGAENFYGDILHQLGGSKLKIYSFLIDPTADPHEYETNAGNARAVADSSLVIENGVGYDSFMEKLLQASPRRDRVVINVQKLVGVPDGANPHLWYDPTVMPRVAKAAADALARLDHANAPVYTAGLAAFGTSFNPLGEEVTALKQRYAGTPVAYTESVFGLMGEAIGLAVKSPEAFMKAVEQGNDPPSRAVADEQDLITTHQVRVLMYNSQTVTKITTQIKELARKNSVPVVGVSETLPPAMNFQEWQLAQLKDLETALARA